MAGVEGLPETLILTNKIGCQHCAYYDSLKAKARLQNTDDSILQR